MKSRLLIILGIIIAIGIVTMLLTMNFLDDKEYDNLETTCNDSLGKPDGDCFVNAFEKCESASIKQSSGTVEGDPVYHYATIIPDNSCSIHYKLDISRDRFKGVFVGNIETTCTNVQIINTQMFLQCEDGEQMIPLW